MLARMFNKVYRSMRGQRIQRLHYLVPIHSKQAEKIIVYNEARAFKRRAIHQR